MKKLIVKNIIRFISASLLGSITIGCVDSLNDPYPGGIFDNQQNDSISDHINPPTELSLDEFTEGKVYGLWWEDNSDNEDGFEIWRKNGFDSYTLINSLPSNSTAANDTITDNNLVYSYKVRAYKNSYYSEFSNEVNTNQSFGLPAPSELSGEAISSTTNVNLIWNDNSSDELGFIIERKIINEFEFSEVERVGPNSISWTDTSDKLQLGLTVYYRVKAYNTVKQSNYSNIFSITL